MKTDNVKILIIEDDIPIDSKLIDFLENEQCQIIACTNQISKAMDLFRNNQVDVLLCDITNEQERKGMLICEQLLQLKKIPLIYLVESSNKDTLKAALRTLPSAYFTKPFLYDNLAIAIHLAAYNNQMRHRKLPISTLEIEKDKIGRECILQIDDYIFIKQHYQFVKVRLVDILYLESNNSYTIIVTTQRKFVVRLTMNTILERIPYEKLVRVHRSYAIHLDKVESFTEQELMIDNVAIPLSRNYKDEFLKQFTFR